MNILLDLSYDGTNFCGFQVQKNGVSVCETVQNALEALFGARPDVKGCGRTDAGVHALHYALNFWAETSIPVEKLPLALNRHLPDTVRVNEARQVPQEFHARYSAHTKTYVYRIWNSPVESPFEAAYHHRVSAPLNAEAMDKAAAKFMGKHDFLSLCSAGSSVAAKGDTVRTISACKVERQGPLVTVTVTADGYLYNMVRILAGTLVEAGRGALDPDAVPAILAGRDRSLAGPTLPAKGLFLKQVDYPPEALGL